MSLFSNLFGGGPNIGALQRKQSALMDRNNGLAELLMQNYYDQARQGAYDPNAQLDLMRRDHDYKARTESRNMAANARIMGYRPGDSEPTLRQRARSERSALNYDQLAAQIRASTQAAQSSALGGAVNGAANIYGNSIGTYSGQINQAIMHDQANQMQFTGLLGTLMPYLGNINFNRRQRSNGLVGMVQHTDGSHGAA